MSANYQSLYRRFRPQRFSEVLGQDHVTRALRAAVASDSVGHAYLFSGPRGTGKTSTARILAKALNCENLVDGEPCLVCPSCVSIASGSSGEVEELDAASNSGVDAMRWLIGTVATAGTGRWKVYIIDEVHMLSTAASNALLKTLEEPPPHVIFILATTNPQKVLQTVVSRTQHFEFHLLDMSAVGEVVDDIANRTGVELNAATREWVLRRGRGSARDTLSVLEQVLALGQVIPEVDASIELAVVSLLGLDAHATVLAVEGLLQSGNDPLWVVTELLARLKDQFLAALRGEGGEYPLARITRAMETLGRLSIGVRDALDPGVVLEAVLVQLVADSEFGADLEQRVRRLEELARSGGPTTQAREVSAGEVKAEAAEVVRRPLRDDAGSARSPSSDLARLRGAIGRSPGRAGVPTPAAESAQPISAEQQATEQRATEQKAAGPFTPPLQTERSQVASSRTPKPPLTSEGNPGQVRRFTDSTQPRDVVTPAGTTHNVSSQEADFGPLGGRSQGRGEGTYPGDAEVSQPETSSSEMNRVAPAAVAPGENEATLAGELSIASKRSDEVLSAPTHSQRAGEILDAAATDRLRTLIQAEWLERYLPALQQRNIRTWIRDTRLIVLGAGEIGIVLDHETRRKKLEPYFSEIVSLLRQLYGDNLDFRLLLESETDANSANPSVEALVPPDEPIPEADDEEFTTSTPTQRFSDDAIVANVTEVFPGARLIQGEL
ncbi:DNA polymerase III subunit gamma/tau [Ferrimicrobium sp.]|uniref:DNA polymerase III subunit gamma/tau n=1 Tax=Ferrimicrobium sp. TaxID=2926050 RepID=UPI0026146649|nr:DNA polymerase III subunit gamma/tau [Ferrimicrobium sp.]